MTDESGEDPRRKDKIQAAKDAAKENAVNRTNQEKGHAHNLKVMAVYVLGTAIIAMFLVLFYNLASPNPFLTPEKLTALKEFLFSGLIGGVTSGFIKSFKGSDDD